MKNLYFLKVKKTVIISSVFIIMSLLNGCMMNFYRVQSLQKSNPQEITKYISMNKYLIVHQVNSARYLLNPILTDNVLSGELINLPTNHQLYKTRQLKSANRYRRNMKTNESPVLDEVHLYLGDSIVAGFDTVRQVRIPLAAISYTDINKKADVTTFVSWSIPIVIPVIIIVVIASSLTFNIPLVF